MKSLVRSPYQIGRRMVSDLLSLPLPGDFGWSRWPRQVLKVASHDVAKAVNLCGSAVKFCSNLQAVKTNRLLPTSQISHSEAAHYSLLTSCQQHQDTWRPPLGKQ